jgi:hypothetical protein
MVAKSPPATRFAIKHHFLSGKKTTSKIPWPKTKENVTQKKPVTQKNRKLPVFDGVSAPRARKASGRFLPSIQTLIAEAHWVSDSVVSHGFRQSIQNVAIAQWVESNSQRLRAGIGPQAFTFGILIFKVTIGIRRAN